MDITLPEVAKPVAAYTPAVVTGHYVYTSGQLPFVEGKLEKTGKVGAEVASTPSPQWSTVPLSSWKRFLGRRACTLAPPSALLSCRWTRPWKSNSSWNFKGQRCNILLTVCFAR